MTTECIVHVSRKESFASSSQAHTEPTRYVKLKQTWRSTTKVWNGYGFICSAIAVTLPLKATGNVKQLWTLLTAQPPRFGTKRAQKVSAKRTEEENRHVRECCYLPLSRGISCCGSWLVEQQHQYKHGSTAWLNMTFKEKKNDDLC